MVGLWCFKVTMLERYENLVEPRIQHSPKMPINTPSAGNYNIAICLWKEVYLPEKKKTQPFANMYLV